MKAILILVLLHNQDFSIKQRNMDLAQLALLHNVLNDLCRKLIQFTVYNPCGYFTWHNHFIQNFTENIVRNF